MKSLRSAIPPLSIAAVAVSIAVAPSRDRPGGQGHGSATQPPAPCQADVRALLGGLSEGSELAGFRVKGLDCGAPRVVDVHVDRSGSSLVVSVAAKGSLPYAPPAETERTALFYGNFSGSAARPSGEELAALVDAIAARVRAAEGKGLPSGW